MVHLLGTIGKTPQLDNIFFWAGKTKERPLTSHPEVRVGGQTIKDAPPKDVRASKALGIIVGFPSKV
jgi:hypothetical protein